MDFIYTFLNYIIYSIEINYFQSLIIFTLFLLFYNSLSLPGNALIMISTGYFFGIYIGFLISIFTLVFGSLFFYIFISFILFKFFPKIVTNYSNKVNQYVGSSSFEYIVLFRIIPGTPLIIQNLILSILKVDLFKFLLSTMIGFTPLVFVLVFFGFQLKNIDSLRDFSISDIFSYEFLIFIFFIVFLIFIRILYKKRPSNK
tara:strand:+ start:49 stop:651 length:603 start_codon:yes stop_codon:yes gene_type:complete